MTTNSMNSIFKRATKTQSKLRMALYGVSGSGKTYSALAIATGLGGRIAVIDTERGSASKYASRFEFDVLDMQPPFSPASYVQAIKAAEAEGYDILIIDSLTHAWSGTGGALEMVDDAAKRSKSGNTYVAWRDVTPQHTALIDAIVQSRCHVIATMRSKTEYVIEKNSNGKDMPRKMGMAPIQRKGMEYEFDVVAEMTIENDLIVQKSRCEALTGLIVSKPNGQVSQALRDWLTDGAPAQVISPAERWHRWASSVIVNADTKDTVRAEFEKAVAELQLESIKPVFDSLKGAVVWLKEQTAPAQAQSVIEGE